MDVWQWLSVESNQKVLAVLGASLAAVVTAGWAVFTWKHPKPKNDKPAVPPLSTQSATASNGGIAVNAAGENNQIHIGK